MPLTPQQDAFCQKLEQQVAPEIGLAAAALIRQQASEIDSLWDRLTHAYMAMRGEVGDNFRFEDEVEELQRLARSKAEQKRTWRSTFFRCTASMRKERRFP